MERLYGHWLLYLRFVAGGRERVLHVLCENQDQINRLLKIAAGPASGVQLLEHAAWSSLQKIHTRVAAMQTDKDLMTYETFVDTFGDVPG